MAHHEEDTLVTVVIDDVEYQMPEGMNLVDAAKVYADNDIPVFCYHPKLGNAGNCRMCLVELGSPRRNRETGEMELAWFPTLQTACTQTVREGLHVRTATQWVADGRREILEFLLSSHPLDCPICDKGGECPLQNLTMRHGPGTSRMYWNDKMRLGKHIPLGEIIYLDQERCIHCARCIRFQEAIVDDPVLSFDKRGRKQQIITNSDPGFDSIFSGNTTDICPVGALTTADFRFNARPWEMQAIGGIDPHTPEGANFVYDVRPDREKGGMNTIKRIMPRQNEAVNEIWISDKTRFVHHYMDHPDRLTTPHIRKNGQLTPATWDEALEVVATKLNAAGARAAAIGGPRLANEDFFAIQALIRAMGSSSLAAYPALMDGADIVNQVGVASGTNLGDLGAGDAILVVASDLHQEAPIWWVRVKQAVERGAQLVLVTGRETRLDKWAAHIIRSPYGGEASALNALGDDVMQVLNGATHMVALVGSEGMSPATSRAVAQAAANLLIETGHVGQAGSGLIMVWPGANLQGAYDMGFHHRLGPGYEPVDEAGLDYAGIIEGLTNGGVEFLLVAGANPVFDDADAEAALSGTGAFVVVQDLFLTETAEFADVVLPAQSTAEREGTFTNGERRVQRFYQAIEPLGYELIDQGGGARADWLIARQLHNKLGGPVPEIAATQLFAQIAKTVPQYNGMSHAKLARVVPQFPDVGGDDLYYGGTSYTNVHGTGMQWPVRAEMGSEHVSTAGVDAPAAVQPEDGMLVVVPTTSHYNRERIFTYTDVLDQRIPLPYAALNPTTAEGLGVTDDERIVIRLDGRDVPVTVLVDPSVPENTAIVPRRLQKQGAPHATTTAPVLRMERVEQ
ncbi:MAG: NADH-quinone oxidoreductase subunit NuoG [Chloroflexi bacterium]|nr:NADH-quinone oxidoreductase subunit NuoG [Chloroflexota bacterium]